MKVVGVDLSMTSTGVAVISDTFGPYVDRIQTKPNGSDLVSRRRRLRKIAEQVASFTGSSDLVVIEGLAYGSASPHASERAGLWWLVVDSLVSRDIPVATVAPMARAKYATGKGNASKDAVLAAVVRRYADVNVTGNDEADALVLAAAGARYLGHPIEASLPQAHLDALGKAEWPDGLAGISAGASHKNG